MGASAEPSRSIEIERKFDVDAGTPVPDWTRIDGVVRVSDGEPRALDAVYYDTDARDLARAGVAVRRRTGGPDAGWHIKGPLVDGGRLELGWPLDEGDTVPDEVVAELTAWTTDPLSPLARIENDRTAYELLGADGGAIAEFVDDRVRATDLRAGRTRAWCEWEVELRQPAPTDRGEREALLAAIDEVALSSGARAPQSASKLARALGH